MAAKTNEMKVMEAIAKPQAKLSYSEIIRDFEKHYGFYPYLRRSYVRKASATALAKAQAALN